MFHKVSLHLFNVCNACSVQSRILMWSQIATYVVSKDCWKPQQAHSLYITDGLRLAEHYPRISRHFY